MHHSIRTLSVISLALLLGCASGPTDEELNNADFGPEMSQQLCEIAAKEFMESILKDPESARYKQFTTCRKHVSAVFSSDGSFTSGRVAGYLISFMVNSKNSFGGYSGQTEMVVLLRGAELVALAEGPCEANMYGYTFCWGGKELYLPNSRILKRMIKESGF